MNVEDLFKGRKIIFEDDNFGLLTRYINWHYKLRLKFNITNNNNNMTIVIGYKNLAHGNYKIRIWWHIASTKYKRHMVKKRRSAHGDRHTTLLVVVSTGLPGAV